MARLKLRGLGLRGAKAAGQPQSKTLRAARNDRTSVSIIFSPSRGGTELMGFEETIVNPFGADLIISWYTNYSAGFQLQTASALSSSNWVNVTNAITITNTSYQVRIPMSGGGAFYRLQH